VMKKCCMRKLLFQPSTEQHHNRYARLFPPHPEAAGDLTSGVFQDRLV
jgi:hypothetical protein